MQSIPSLALLSQSFPNCRTKARRATTDNYNVEIGLIFAIDVHAHDVNKIFQEGRTIQITGNASGPGPTLNETAASKILSLTPVSVPDLLHQ